MPKGARGRHCIMHRATKRRVPFDAMHGEVVGGVRERSDCAAGTAFESWLN